MPNRSEPRVITPGLLRDWALPVPAGGKETRGTVLVVGGSRFTPGAVLLAGVAALRAGAGVLQLAAAESTAAALSIQVPEALVVGLPETAGGAVAGGSDDQLGELLADADVVALGPGLKEVDETRRLLHLVLDAAGPRAPLVLDAYALGALSHEPDLLVGSGRPAVLTPNVTEAGHLLGRDPGDDLDAATAGSASWPGAARRDPAHPGHRLTPFVPPGRVCVTSHRLSTLEYRRRASARLRPGLSPPGSAPAGTRPWESV